MSLLIGRLILGLGVGIEMIVIPLYLSESMPLHLRGRSITLFQLFLTIGILVAFYINYLFVNTGNWRGMFMCAFVPGILLLIGACFIAESPRWLYLRNRKEKAKMILGKICDASEAKKTFDEMHTLLDASANTHHSYPILKWKIYHVIPFLIALAIACLNQLTGINSVLQYGAVILENAGINSHITSILGTVGIGFINMCFTVVALFLVDTVGRKPLVIIGTAGVSLSLILMGLVSFFMPHTLVSGYLILAGLLFYIAFFAIGPGVVVWLAISELLPTQIRSKGMAICLFANNVVSTLLAFLFLHLVHLVNYSGVFFFCGICTVLYFIIALRVFPETKDETLEDIEQGFRKQSESTL
jgi:sugar porter (SP) family MFS transporter